LRLRTDHQRKRKGGEAEQAFHSSILPRTIWTLF
jgi:hypothetical protein